MSTSKDRYYWAQLRLALTLGQWSSKFPVSTPNGIALSWPELFRKFNKHCRGFQHVAQVASQIQALALLLSANSQDEDQDDLPTESKDVYPVKLAQECVLPEEWKEEAQAGYDILIGLQMSNFDSLNFALAYYAFALGNPAECVSHLSNVPDMINLQSHIPRETDPKTPVTPSTGHSSHIGLHVPGLSPGTSLSSTVGSSVSLAESSIADSKDGRVWSLTETVRSVCLGGMSHEKLSPNDPSVTLKAYSTVLPLLETLDTIIADPTLVAAPASDTRIFVNYRELWRWIERLLWRAIVVSARIADPRHPGMDVWAWFRHYSACSVYWPATFRTSHRSTVSVLYFRALILRYHPTHAHAYLSSSKPIQAQAQPETEKAGGEKDWLHTARTLVNDYRGILSTCTSFPHAGKRNIRVEDFVDFCVGIWEAGGAGGEGAGWVLDILWWATRLTFNSHRILRHMTRLLHISGDTSLARRTLLLYVQVVGKAYEASHANANSNSSAKGQMEPEDSVDKAADSDRDWVETLVSGARMLCRWAAAQPGLEGLKELREAKTCIEKARTRLHPKTDEMRLCASVDLAEGVWNLVMAFKEQDPHTRPERLSSAHTLLQRACFLPAYDSSSLPSSASPESEISPEPAALYHLALSFAFPGPTQNLEQAIFYAGRAVEGDSQEIRYWHLLGLLLAALERWDEAKEILERGASIGEVDGDDSGDDAGDDDEQDKAGTSIDALKPLNVAEAAVTEKDFAEREPTATEKTIDIVIPVEASRRLPLLDGDHIPSPKLLLAPAQDHPQLPKQEIFEYALQLRMTQGVLTEVMDGAEGAEEKWVDIFSWVADRRASGTNEPTPRPSMDVRTQSFLASPLQSEAVLPPLETRASLPASIPADVGEGQEVLHYAPIPITISPATPDAENLHKRLDNRKRSSSTERDTSKSKKVQQMLKNRVHKGHERITTISKKIGNGVARTGSLRRANSTPDFHAILKQTSYQASSIHSRRRISSFLHNSHAHDRTPTESPPPPPTPVPPPPPTPSERNRHSREARMQRLIANLWLMSAATFRRLGKIEQARGAIQEAEVRDDGNPGVWVQLGLYYAALGRREDAVETLQKALFIDPDDVPASVHLARLYLTLHDSTGPIDRASMVATCPVPVGVDLAAGMLSHLTRGTGWHVPEAWYYLAKAYGMQGRKDRERECLEFSLALSRSRGIREIGSAVGLCI